MNTERLIDRLICDTIKESKITAMKPDEIRTPCIIDKIWEPFISDNDVCGILNITKQELFRMRKRKVLTYYKIGHKTIRYKMSDVMAMLEKSCIKEI